MAARAVRLDEVDVLMKVVIAVGRELPLRIERGQLVGQDSGTHLLRRMIGYWPGCAILSEVPEQCDGFRLIGPNSVRNTESLVISMAPMETISTYWALRTSVMRTPHLVNFFWSNIGDFTGRKPQQLLGCALGAFPTFANSPRMLGELKNVARKAVSPSVFAENRWAACPLGVEVDKIPFRVSDARPVQVMYPSLFLMQRKQPEIFEEVVLTGLAGLDVAVQANLAPGYLDSEMAREWRGHGWFVGPPPSREQYLEELAGQDVFLATAREESYGLQYLELMAAGAVGVFPDRPWARAILPGDYPLLFRSKDEAKAMLRLAAQDGILRANLAGECRAMVELHHDSALFDKVFPSVMEEWFAGLYAPSVQKRKPGSRTI